MIVYRISSPKWAEDISGTGAKMYGGRWNSAGFAMLYTSENISLCMLEILVNATRQQLKMPFALVQIEIPDSIWFPDKEFLPQNWNTYPHSPESAYFGNNWLQSFNNLALKVPSSANEFEHNILLNPLHPEFAKVQILKISNFSFEQRLIGAV